MVVVELEESGVAMDPRARIKKNQKRRKMMNDTRADTKQVRGVWRRIVVAREGATGGAVKKYGGA